MRPGNPDNPETAKAFRDLVAGDRQLLAILGECRKQANLAPLGDYREKVEQSGDEAERARTNELYKLLTAPQ